ncbi:hypothetical protein [Planktotalea arctica]|uniref:hypothetical protein n=1 Tax=Planktotalea arctica TaxID=1481893 RepID=UPI000A172911|nr:hypothetical protein [Planktotalea arctica]
MIRFTVLCTILMSVSACNGTNPFMVDEATSTSTQSGTAAEEDTTTSAPIVTETTTNSGDPISSDRTILPGTTNPSPNNTIFRREAQAGETGNGFAEGFAYNSVNDTFTVDNLAFDGEGPYTAVRDNLGNRIGIGPFNVFENEATVVDGLTLANINQLTYRALYSVGPDGNTSIAIIRTGAYMDYGFGGYIYQRNGGVTLPTSGQANYSGTNNYGGLRDFIGQGGLEYVRGDIEVNIDFNDFNAGSGVIGVVSNRRVFDLANNDVTSTILSAQGGTQLPTLFFDIEPGVLDSNGELSGTIQSSFGGEVFEEGSYYAILSGDNAETITGIIVVTGDDPRNSNVTFRETAGFFAVRQ